MKTKSIIASLLVGTASGIGMQRNKGSTSEKIYRLREQIEQLKVLVKRDPKCCTVKLREYLTDLKRLEDATKDHEGSMFKTSNGAELKKTAQFGRTKPNDMMNPDDTMGGLYEPVAKSLKQRQIFQLSSDVVNPSLKRPQILNFTRPPMEQAPMEQATCKLHGAGINIGDHRFVLQDLRVDSNKRSYAHFLTYKGGEARDMLAYTSKSGGKWRATSGYDLQRKLKKGDRSYTAENLLHPLLAEGLRACDAFKKDAPNNNMPKHWETIMGSEQAQKREYVADIYGDVEEVTFKELKHPDGTLPGPGGIDANSIARNNFADPMWIAPLWLDQSKGQLDHWTQLTIQVVNRWYKNNVKIDFKQFLQKRKAHHSLLPKAEIYTFEGTIKSEHITKETGGDGTPEGMWNRQKAEFPGKLRVTFEIGHDEDSNTTWLNNAYPSKDSNATTRYGMRPEFFQLSLLQTKPLDYVGQNIKTLKEYFDKTPDDVKSNSLAFYADGTYVSMRSMLREFFMFQDFRKLVLGKEAIPLFGSERLFA